LENALRYVNQAAMAEEMSGSSSQRLFYDCPSSKPVDIPAAADKSESQPTSSADADTDTSEVQSSLELYSSDPRYDNHCWTVSGSSVKLSVYKNTTYDVPANWRLLGLSSPTTTSATNMEAGQATVDCHTSASQSSGARRGNGVYDSPKPLGVNYSNTSSQSAKVINNYVSI
jgi:hypothetical protein